MGLTDWANCNGSRRTCEYDFFHQFLTQWVRSVVISEAGPSLTILKYRYQIATGAGDDTIRVWDMRSLKALYTIPAHKSNVSDVRFVRLTSNEISMQNGLMEVDSTEGIRAKTNHIAELYKSGLYLASAGYDGYIKLWSADDWQLQRSIAVDAGKVMSVDLSSDGKYIASGSWNRSYQLFSPEDSI